MVKMAKNTAAVMAALAGVWMMLAPIEGGSIATAAAGLALFCIGCALGKE